jgi:hypothetical protein
MSNARTTGVLLASFVALFVFFFQTSACYAERAGFIPCHEQHHENDESSSKAHEGNGAECCHLESSCTLLQPVTFVPHVLSMAIYHSRNEGAHDGPVAEIDYPPQLLS